MKNGETSGSTRSSEHSAWDKLKTVEFVGSKPKFSPNQAYIDSVGDEPKMRELLRDKDTLDKISESYLNQYEPNSNAAAFDLAAKEAMDHFVVKRLSSSDPEMFIGSREFKNYCDYIMKLADEKKFEFANKKVAINPEFFTNPAFKDRKMRELIFKTAYPNASLDKMNDWYDRHEAYYKDQIRHFVEDGMEKHHRLSQKQMDIVGDYVYAGKNFDDGVAEKYAKYCFNDLDEDSNIRPSTPMIGALTNYFANQYTADEDIRENSRIIIANYKGNGYKENLHIGASTSFGCILEQSHFLDMSLTSDDSLNKSRTNRSNDLYRLMMITFHELTHDHQKNEVKRGHKNSSAMSYILNKVLNRGGLQCYSKEKDDGTTATNSYYGVNHDSDEIEIQADEEAWRQCRAFLAKHQRDYFAGQDQEKSAKAYDRWAKCFDREKEVSARRAFVKKLAATGETMPSIQFDIQGLKAHIKERPEYLQRFPQLVGYIDSSGNLKPELLFNTRLARTEREGLDSRTDVFGTEVGAYILTEPDETGNLMRYIIDNKEKISPEQIKNLISNLGSIVHQDVDKVRVLNGIDFGTYDETRTRGKNLSPEEMKAALFTQYMRQCFCALSVAKLLKGTFPEMSDYIGKYEEDHFGGYYYDQFTQNGAKLDPNFARDVVLAYERIDNPTLLRVANMVRRDYGL